MNLLFSIILLFGVVVYSQQTNANTVEIWGGLVLSSVYMSTHQILKALEAKDAR
jgi:nitrogen fixation protein FixH